MTYIFGLAHRGINSIIADTRVSYPGTTLQGRNVALKTGVLFPGCIFGVAGNFKNAEDFVLAAKYAVKGNSANDLWKQFQDFAANFHFPNSPREAFQILLSSRANGPPLFYGLDYFGLHELGQCWVTFGSGSEILDRRIHEVYRDHIAKLDEQLGENEEYRMQAIFAPYAICFWLTQASQSLERTLLEDHGVGGVFHCIMQDSEAERRQGPTLYLLGHHELKVKTTYWWQYRVFAVGHGICINTCIPPDQLQGAPEGRQDDIALLNSMAVPASLRGYPDPAAEIKEFRDAIETEAEKLPLYTFLGFGATDYERNKRWGFQMGGKPLVTENGIDPYVYWRLFGDPDH